MKPSSSRTPRRAWRAALAGGFWAVGLGPEERVGAAHVVFLSLEGVHLSDILAAVRRATGEP